MTEPPAVAAARERLRRLPEWRLEVNAALDELAGLLGVEPGTSLIDQPAVALPRLESLLREADLASLDDDERTRLATLLLAFLGQVLLRDHQADWTVDPDPGSPSCGHYVLGRTSHGSPQPPFVDVGEVVHRLLASPRGRSVVAALAEAEARWTDRPPRPER